MMRSGAPTKSTKIINPIIIEITSIGLTGLAPFQSRLTHTYEMEPENMLFDTLLKKRGNDDFPRFL